MLFAVDPVAAVVDEATAWGADLVVTHHPLLLRPVHSIAATTFKGALLHRLVRSGTALYTAHTNADAAAGGVNDALAAALGLRRHGAAGPRARPRRWTSTWCSSPSRTRSAWSTRSRPRAPERSASTRGARGRRPARGRSPRPRLRRPPIGSAGEASRVVEARVEMVAPRRLRSSVVAAMRAAHPYEEPAFDVLELASWPGSTGTGRVGTLAEPTTLRAFAAAVAAALPATAQGVRFAGDPDGRVERVAVVGGSGDSFFDAVRASGVDAYVTADLRHHPTSELRERAEHEGSSGTPYLVDVAHFASEWPWLALRGPRPGAGRRRRGDYGGDPRQHGEHRPVDGTRREPGTA